MATRNIVPRATGEGGIGTAAKKWALGWINALVVTTLNALTLTAAAVGFTIAGGTTSKTLTVTADTSLDEVVAMSSKATQTNSSFTGTLTGCTTAPTATIRYSKNGNMVSLTMQALLTGTSNDATKTITGMPAALFPSVATQFIAATSDNGGAMIASYVSINTSGVISFGRNLDGASFTVSGTATIDKFTVTYPR